MDKFNVTIIDFITYPITQTIMNYRRLCYFLFVLLLVGCTKEPKPTASFTVSNSTAAVGEIITFTNTSKDATSYSWDFGDGSSSVSENPTHAYSIVGTFNVELTAIGDGGTSTSSQSITITANMTGSWWWEFSLSGTLFNGPFELVEHGDGSLTGTFDFSDGSGFENIEPNSNITGDAVLIEVDHNPEYDLYMSFRGTANAGRDNMTGSIYINSTYIGSYTASKTTKKSTPVNTSDHIISALDSLLDVILKK